MIAKEPRNLQHQAEHTSPGRRVNVISYLVILFLAAFLLLGFAYLQQQRINEETTDALKQSNSAVESIQNLMDENEALRQQVEDLKDTVNELDAVRREQNLNLERLNNEMTAMQWFWQIDDYYVRGAYRTARSLIQEFEATGLKEALPHENTTGTDRFSPAARYQEIYDALY